ERPRAAAIVGLRHRAAAAGPAEVGRDEPDALHAVSVRHGDLGPGLPTVGGLEHLPGRATGVELDGDVADLGRGERDLPPPLAAGTVAAADEPALPRRPAVLGPEHDGPPSETERVRPADGEPALRVEEVHVYEALGERRRDVGGLPRRPAVGRLDDVGRPAVLPDTVDRLRVHGEEP